MSSFDGLFVWYELHTKDLEAAMKFYQNVVGWNRRKMEGAGQPYNTFAVGERGVAGAMTLPPGLDAPPHWLGYVGTPDVDRTASQAEKMGAKLHVRPQDIPTVGRFAVMQDPQGAYVALFAPQPMPGESPRPASPGVGDFSWHELVTTNLDAAFKFYGELFGWVKKETHDMGEMGTYQIYGTQEKVLGGAYKKPADMPAPPHFLFYTRVANLDTSAEKVKSSGGTVLHGPVEVPGGDRIAICLDPQGAAFAMQS